MMVLLFFLLFFVFGPAHLLRRSNNNRPHEDEPQRRGWITVFSSPRQPVMLLGTARGVFYWDIRGQ
jgi:hypothetical protein